jgi:Domain of unknown function (DUF4440)
MSREEQTLCDLAIQMGECEKRRDAPFFESLLSDKLTFRRAGGNVTDKPAFIKDLLEPANSYEVLEARDVSAEVLDGVGIVTLVVRAKGKRGEIEFAGDFRNIRIFLRAPDKDPPWELHAWFNVKMQRCDDGAANI